MPSLTEWLGFLTGAACVWLVVKQNIWTYPLGIANNVLFFVLFAQARLYGDAGLQVLYLLLAIQGWYLWLRGGEHHTALGVSRGSRLWIGGTVVFVGAATVALRSLLSAAGGAAPWLDALTTSLSLGAQWLQNRKKLEHWYFWITADVFYLFLYGSRGLWLTGLLYAIFLGMCLVGLREWRRAIAAT